MTEENLEEYFKETIVGIDPDIVRKWIDIFKFSRDNDDTDLSSGMVIDDRTQQFKLDETEVIKIILDEYISILRLHKEGRLKQQKAVKRLMIRLTEQYQKEKGENVNIVDNKGNYRKDPKRRAGSTEIRINTPLKFTKKWEAISFVERLLSTSYGCFWFATYLFNHFLLMDLDDINYIMGSFFQGLQRKEYSILIMRFSKQMVLREVGMILDLTPENIRQTEARALRKLRHPLRSMRLKKILLPGELHEIEEYDSLDEIEKDKWVTEKVKEYETAKEIQMEKEKDGLKGE
jgi:hypothetical protein